MTDEMKLRKRAEGLTAATAPLNTSYDMYDGDDKMLQGRVFHQATVRGK